MRSIREIRSLTGGTVVAQRCANSDGYMSHCPKCGRMIESEPICPDCGLMLLGGGVPGAPSASDGKPTGTPKPSPTAVPAARTVTPKQPQTFLLLVAIVVTAIRSLMLLASASRMPIAPETAPSPGARTGSANVASQLSPSPVSGKAPTDQTSLPSPQWTSSVPGRRSGFGANTVVYELAADQEVDVWRKRVRAVLTVRCTTRETEVFIVTHSPAAIEPESSLHTVKLAFDGQPAEPETWEHSIDHDALFAPDGLALARRIATSRKMSFTFTPFNASPAVIPFTVDGFDERLKSAGKKCS